MAVLDKKKKTMIRLVKADPGLINKHHMTTRAKSSSFGACVEKMRWWWRWSGVNLGICLDVKNDILLLLNVFESYGQRHGMKLVRSAPR